MKDSYTPPQMPCRLTEQDRYKGLSDDERICLAIYQVIGYIFAVFVAIIFCIIFPSSCTTPKAIEQHQHRQHEADTLAIQARIDQSLKAWGHQMDSSWQHTWKDYSATMISNEGQKEHITETITTYIDSLGREVRQEQRTTDRTISKMQQQSEQRLSSEFEHRLRVAVDSVNGIWQAKFNTLQAHWQQSDSTDIKETPAKKTEQPWYKRWWQSLKDYLLITAIIFALFVSVRYWRYG